MKNLYYEAPPDDSFLDLKQAAIEIWNSYEDPYRTEKIHQIKGLRNDSDNFMYLFAMFDAQNQRNVVARLRHGTREEIRNRLIAGGSTPLILMMIGL